MSDQIIVLTLSEVQSTTPKYAGQTPVYRGPVAYMGDGADYALYSAGKLEQALAAGYVVYVASKRTELGEHDAWWLAHVPRERIFLYDELRLSPDNPGVPAAKAGSLAILPWQRLYAALGLPWDEAFGDRVKNARAGLERHGILTGDIFTTVSGAA